MAEFASAIAGLVLAAETVTRYVGRYVRHVKNADHEVLSLLVRVNRLYGALTSLQLLIDDFKLQERGISVDATQMTGCVEILEKLRAKAIQSDKTTAVPESSLLLHSKWIWPFAAPETRELTKELEASC